MAIIILMENVRFVGGKMSEKPKIFVETTGQGKENWEIVKAMLKENYECDISLYNIIKMDFDIVELKKKSIESCTCHYLNDLKTLVKCYTHGYKEFKKRKKKNIKRR